MASLYERIGGEGAVMAAASLFYERVLADPLTAPFFEALDMEAQIKKQIAFLSWAFGGPGEYRGRDLRIAHAPLIERGLSDAHFDAVADHLRAALVELEVDDGTIAEVLGIVATTRVQVLNR
jgi:hemoglobin